MKSRCLHKDIDVYFLFVVLASLVGPPVLAQTIPAADKSEDKSFYAYRIASRDVIGKFYMGREISRTLGHQAVR